MATAQPLEPVSRREQTRAGICADLGGGAATSGVWSLPAEGHGDAFAWVEWRLRWEPDRTCHVELAVSGELDLATAPRLSASVARLCTFVDRPSRVVELLVDTADVTFLDTSGLDALSDLYARAQARGWTLRLIPPVAAAPCRVLLIAVREGWLPSTGWPGSPPLSGGRRTA